MKQLVQLQNELGTRFQREGVQVLVIFREESEGQQGLDKVVQQTKTSFTLALDEDAESTGSYSRGNRVHDSYLVGSDGVLRTILPGKRYDRARADEFAKALDALVDVGK